MREIIVYGASGHGKVVADIIRLDDDVSLLGFVDDAKSKQGVTEFFGAVILGGFDWFMHNARSADQEIIVAVGDNNVRLSLAARLSALGIRFYTAIHLRAIVAPSAKIGEGTVVMAGAVVNADARIGNHSIINTCCTVDHDCVLGEGVHISPGANLAGGVRIGERSHVGIGSSVKQDVTIGARTIVGAGAIVVKDMPDDCVVCGVPAKVIRKREEHQ